MSAAPNEPASVILNRQLPFRVPPKTFASGVFGRKLPRNGAFPSPIDAAAKSSNVVRAPSGEHATPKSDWAPPLPSVNSTSLPLGVIKETVMSESIGALNQSDTVILANPVLMSVTTFVDSIVPTSGMLVGTLTSNRIGSVDATPLCSRIGTLKAPWLDVVTLN